MAVEKIMTPRDLAKAETTEEEVTVEVLNPEAVSVETEDGGMIIDFTGDQVDEIMSGGFDANLAEEIEEADLQSMASELISSFNSDRQSRSEWAKSYVKGLDLLGMKIEERQQPWAGSSGVFHPILTESIVRFPVEVSISLSFAPSAS